MAGSPIVTSSEALAYFERLLALDPPTHAQELDTLKRTRPDLYPQVLELIESDRKAGAEKFLEDGPRLPPEAAPALLSPLSAGQTIGVYRIERRLGVGGMGEVWLGARADGRYQGQVAIKILHPQLARSGLRERFLREGQILASLSHPNIARLLDAGAAEPGLLYLVLEYIEGERIDHWCEQRALDVPARLRLFLQVCGAVGHAHTHLVVHRDLKPSNILVTRDGAVKLLDFGIAKLLESEDALAPVTELTRVGGRALTPEYAAPEQVKNEPITTATDVYSLGVVLFGLLSGARPYGSTGSTAAQLERAVVETEPKRLSEAAPRERRKSLRGDLDNILAKSLRKNPAERYASVQALADDLRRYLNFEPVSARPDAFSYRARKFLRRHWVGAAATAAVLLAILAGATAALWQARIAETQARHAERQWQRAERVKTFVLSLFEENDPFRRAQAQARSAGELVSAGLARIDRELAQDPALQADLLADLGNVQINLGDLAKAEQSFLRALALQQNLHGADSPETARVEALLARCEVQTGRFAEAGPRIERALPRLQAALGPDHAEVIALLRAQVRTLVNAAKFEQALAVSQRVVDGYTRSRGADDPETAMSLTVQGMALDQLARTAEAEAVLLDAIARLERSLGTEHARLIYPLLLLGTLQKRVERYAEAAQNLDRVVLIGRKHLGQQHVLVGRALAERGDTLRRLKRPEDAARALTEAGPILEPLNNPESGLLWIFRGRSAMDGGHYAEARRAFSEADRIYSATLGETSLDTWSARSARGAAMARLGRLREAETVQREALAAAAKLAGEDSPGWAELAAELAETLRLAGRMDEAKVLLKRAGG